MDEYLETQKSEMSGKGETQKGISDNRRGYAELFSLKYICFGQFKSSETVVTRRRFSVITKKCQHKG